MAVMTKNPYGDVEVANPYGDKAVDDPIYPKSGKTVFDQASATAVGEPPPVDAAFQGIAPSPTPSFNLQPEGPPAEARTAYPQVDPGILKQVETALAGPEPVEPTQDVRIDISPKAPGLWDQTRKVWERSGQNIELDFLWHKVAMGELDEKVARQKQGEFDKISKADPIKGRHWAQNLFLQTVGVARPMAEGTVEGAAAGTAAAGTAAVAGQLGPQAAFPEEIVTVPGAFAAGQVAGSVNYWSQQGSGSIYRQARKQGVSQKASSYAAAAGGPLYAFIEYSQVDRLIPGIGKLKRKLLNKAIQIGATTAKEVAEEGVQRVITDGAVNMARLVEGEIKAADIPAEAKTMALNALNEMKEAAGPMAVLGLGGATVSAGLDTATGRTSGPPVQREADAAAAGAENVAAQQAINREAGVKEMTLDQMREQVSLMRKQLETLPAGEKKKQLIAEIDALEHLMGQKGGIGAIGPGVSVAERQAAEKAPERPVSGREEVPAPEAVVEPVAQKPPTTEPGDVPEAKPPATPKAAEADEILPEGGEIRAESAPISGPETTIRAESGPIRPPKKPTAKKVEKPAEQATTETTPKTAEEVKKTLDTDFTAIPPKTFSLRKEAIERERERLGLDGPESANKESFRQWQKEAQEAKIPEKATQIANEIINEPRALSPKEIAGLGIRLAEVTIDLEKSEEAMSKLTDEAEVAAKATDMNRLEVERDLLIEAAPEIQHAAGRGLVALKMTIDRSFNLTAVLGRARTALRKKLSSTQKTLFTKLTKENKRLSDQVDALRKKVQDSKANTYIKSRVSARQLSSMTTAQKQANLSKLTAKLKVLAAKGCDN